MDLHTKGIDPPGHLEKYYKRVNSRRRGDNGQHSIRTDNRDPYTSQNLEQLRQELEKRYMRLSPDLAVVSFLVGDTGHFDSDESDKMEVTYNIAIYRNKQRSR